MSERKKDSINLNLAPASFTKKKTSRRKSKNKLEKDFDIKKFRDRMINQLMQEKTESPQLRSNSDNNSSYDQKYREYLQEGYSFNTLVFVNRLIIESQTLDSELRNNFPLHKILLNTVKTLLMNELEITYLSIYLDKLGWITENFEVDENFLLTGFCVKMYLNSDNNYLTDDFNRKKKFNDRFNYWLSFKKEHHKELQITPREVNERFKLLSKPFDTYCKQNFIDYNFIVDRILQMSLPYSETRAERPGSFDQIEVNSRSIHENTLDFIKKEYQDKKNNVQNLGPQSFDTPIQNANFLNTRDIENKKEAPILNKDARAQNHILLQGLNNYNNFNLNSAANTALFRGDSYNFYREFSNNWDRNENYPFFRNDSQLFAPNNDDTDKNFLEKFNLVRNKSVNTLINETLQEQQGNIQNAYPAHDNHIIKVDPSNAPNKSFSFEKSSNLEPENSSESFNISQGLGSKPLQLLEKKNNENPNYFKKMKEEQSKLSKS